MVFYGLMNNKTRCLDGKNIIIIFLILQNKLLFSSQTLEFDKEKIKELVESTKQKTSTKKNKSEKQIIKMNVEHEEAMVQIQQETVNEEVPQVKKNVFFCIKRK